MFDTTDNAQLFYNACNGKAKADENGTPLYMNFVEKGKQDKCLFLLGIHNVFYSIMYSLSDAYYLMRTCNLMF